jgi:hypothetical protein
VRSVSGCCGDACYSSRCFLDSTKFLVRFSRMRFEANLRTWNTFFFHTCARSRTMSHIVRNFTMRGILLETFSDISLWRVQLPTGAWRPPSPKNGKTYGIFRKLRIPNRSTFAMKIQIHREVEKNRGHRCSFVKSRWNFINIHWICWIVVKRKKVLLLKFLEYCPKCRVRQALSNTYCKFCFDTAANRPSKVSMKWGVPNSCCTRHISSKLSRSYSGGQMKEQHFFMIL